jgi:peptidoglycan/xylan/chitin deacetylase (PgdA/CDA1 family)
VITSAAARALRRRRSVVFGYHGVGQAKAEDDPHFLWVTADTMRAHIEVLLDAGFEFCTVAQLAELAGGGEPPPGYAALSFDDGMEDNHSVVLPMLGEYGIPATIFITTGLIGEPNPWLSERLGARMMTEPEIRACADAGIEIGAHTVTHPDMSLLDRDACRAEMAASREHLERVLGAPVLTFAYPFTRYNAEAAQAARDVGFIAAVTGEGRGSWDPYEMQRAGMITGKDGIPSFLLKAAGAYQPLFDSPPARVARASSRPLRRRARALAERRA